MPTVQIGGDASGAIAAVAAAQAAIDGMTGKTVRVHVETSGTGAAMADMAKMGESAEKAGKSSRGMSDDLGRSSGHVSNMAKDAEKLAKDMERAARGGGKGGAEETARQAEALRKMTTDADKARQSVGDLGEGSRDIAKTGDAAVQAGRGLRGLEAGASDAGKGLRGLESGGAAGAHGLSGMDLAMKGLRDTLGDVGSGLSGAGSKLGEFASNAAPSAGAIRGVGLAAGVSALGMGALTAAVAGVGLAGVAEDFRHNSQLMHSGEQAVRGFNREFSAMRGATTAAGSGPMAGVATSMKGVGHELAQLGAANIAPVLNSVASLGNQATGAMQKLAPAIGPATQGLTSLAGAVIGAFGDSGPAVTSFANTVTSHAPQIQAGLSSIIDVASGLGVATVDAIAGFGAADTAVKNLVQPGGRPGAERDGNTIKANMDKMLGARRDPSTGGVDSLGHWGDYDLFGTGAPKPGSPAAAGFAKSQGLPAPGGSAVRPDGSHGFDPSKPFSGMLPDGKGGFTVGTADDSKPKGASGSSHDGDWAKGMSASQIMTAERARIGLPAVGQPHYGGLGAPPPGVGDPLPGAAPPASERGGAPRPVAGFGSGARPLPASAAGGLGVGAVRPFNDMMGAAASQTAGGGADMGGAAVQHIQKAVHVASAAASAGGQSIGGALNTGMAQGQQSTQSVVDTVVIKHTKHIVDLASAGLGVHSPSTEFDYLGRMTSHGYAQGIERESHRAQSATTGLFEQSGLGQYAYANGGAPMTINLPRKSALDQPDPNQDPSNPMLSTSSRSMVPPVNHYGALGMANIQAHNDRAAQLAQGRADLHAKAMANLGVTNPATGQKWVDPARDPKSALNNVNPFAGKAGDPFAGQGAVNRNDPLGKVKEMFAQHGQAMTQGVSVGIAKGTPAAQNQMTQFSRGMQNQHKKDHGISSPATVWIGDGLNLAAGTATGVAQGTPLGVASVNSMSAAMQAAGTYLSDKGLMVGFAWAQNVVTGVQQEIKKSDYQTLGLPQLASRAAMMSLAGTQLLSAGSGAQGYKTPGNAPGLVTLGDAVPAQQEVTVHAHFHLDGQITTISQQAMVNVLEQAGHSIELQASG